MLNTGKVMVRGRLSSVWRECKLLKSFWKPLAVYEGTCQSSLGFSNTLTMLHLIYFLEIHFY